MSKVPRAGGGFFLSFTMGIEEEIKQGQRFKSTIEKAIVNILYTANWLQSKQQDTFKPHGITGQQYNILRILKGQHPKTISGTEIKSRMLDKNSDVSRLLDRLEAKNLITKTTCPSDKRASDVNITDTGLAVLKVIDKELKSLSPAINLSEQEASQLSDLLDKSRTK